MSQELSLNGERVHLRPFRREDITEQYLGWLNDPVVTRFSNQRFRKHDTESCLAYLASFAGGNNLFLSIRRLADDSAIGTITIYQAIQHGTADVGIMVGDANARGKGYGQDAWNTALTWLCEQPQIRKITAGTAGPNVGMQRVMQRSGMVLEATRKAQEIIDGRAEDIVYYALFPLR